MTRRRWAVLAAVLLVGGLALRVAVWRGVPLAGGAPTDGYARAAGVVHVHTTLSDGGGSPEEVIAAARESGLDFVAISDHNTMAAKVVEGYHGGLLTLVGVEVSTIAGHVLGLGLRDPVYRFSGDPLDALEDVRDLGGRSFAAHPTSPRADFRWGGWDLPGPWGVELLNGDSQWRDAGLGRLLKTAILYPLNPRYALLSSITPPTEAVSRWDDLLRRRDCPGITGADAHSRVPLGRGRGLRFPSYASLFSVARVHVLLRRRLSGDAGEDASAIVEALSSGRCYVGLDGLAPADAFSFVAESGGKRYTMGEIAPPARDLRLRAGGRVPQGARIRLLRDGVEWAEAGGELGRLAEGPGVYRAEVRVPGWDVPWVLSNPIYVFGPSEALARARRGAWPEPVPAPEATSVLDRFEGKTAFAAEFDASSSMDTNVLAPGEGPEGQGSARLKFRLGTPGPGRPYVWCALVERRSRDLSGSRGLVFWIRSDRTYRIWVQVRDENPASADQGTEWWFTSVKSSPEWRRVAVPFTGMRSLNPRTDGRLDLDRVRQLVFVLDQGALKPETSGTLWIAGLGLY